MYDQRFHPGAGGRGDKKPTQTARRNKHRTKTFTRPSWIPSRPPKGILVSPAGGHLGAQTASKKEPKTIQQRGEKSRGKKRTQDDLGPVLERSCAVLGHHLGPPDAKKCWKTFYFVTDDFLEDNTMRTRSGEQFGPTKGPEPPQHGPKTGPKSTPKRSKI